METAGRKHISQRLVDRKIISSRSTARVEQLGRGMQTMLRSKRCGGSPGLYGILHIAALQRLQAFKLLKQYTLRGTRRAAASRVGVH